MRQLSQEWAQHLARDVGVMQHRPVRVYGENIYYAWSTDPDLSANCRDAVDEWYSEIKLHNFNSPSGSDGSGHFTQVLWRGSTEVGCSWAKSSDNKIFVVCNYDPAGNFIGTYVENVPPVGGSPGLNLQNPINNNAATGMQQPMVGNAPTGMQQPMVGNAPTGMQQPMVGNAPTGMQQPMVGNAPTGSSSGDFVQDCLAAHNEYRAKHGVPPLRRNDKLSQFGQEWAEHLAKEVGVMQHRPVRTYGENIYYAWSTDPGFSVNCRAAVDDWYSEIKLHDFHSPSGSDGSGHFTQVLWRGSTEVGCGWAKSSENKIFVVCNYDPAGNFIGTYVGNVPPVGGSAESDLQNQAVNNATNGSGSGNFVQETLIAHNEYRAKHGVPPLRLNDELSQYSQEWAEHLANDVGAVELRPNRKYGENNYYAYSKDPAFSISGRDAVDEWYSEIKLYNFNSATGPDKSRKDILDMVRNKGKLTKVLWKQSSELGVGYAKSQDGKIFVVCNYNPAGNVDGQYTGNVPPVGGFSRRELQNQSETPTKSSFTDPSQMLGGLQSLF